MISIVSTFYGEWPMLRRRIEEWKPFSGPKLILNDGWPDRMHFARLCGPDIIAVSKLDDQGFCSHQLRDWAMDFVETPWVLLTDMDIAWPAETMAALADCDPTTATRWMFRLTEPVSGYDPFPSDPHGRTKRDVHPNIHLLPTDMARYPEELYGQHAGDDGFFERLPPDYEVFPAPVTMEKKVTPRR